MKLTTYLALIGGACAQTDDAEILDDFYGVVVCNGWGNEQCQKNSDYLLGILEEVESLFEEERRPDKGFKCATPKHPDDDEYDYSTYVALAANENDQDIKICVPDKWCFNPTEENVFNLEFEGIRDLIKFDNCENDQIPCRENETRDNTGECQPNPAVECAPNQIRPSKYKCEACPAGQKPNEQNGRKCVCPEGEKKVDGVCQPCPGGTCTVVEECADGQTLIDGVCEDDCEDGYVRDRDGYCDIPKCRGNEIRADDGIRCKKCPAGQKANRGTNVCEEPPTISGGGDGGGAAVKLQGVFAFVATIAIFASM